MLDDLPPFMTVEQAAKLLQLGRSKTYELTVEWERTDGRVRPPVREVRHAEADPARRARSRWVEAQLDRRRPGRDLP